jgi:hypothetical protein
MMCLFKIRSRFLSNIVLQMLSSSRSMSISISFWSFLAYSREVIYFWTSSSGKLSGFWSNLEHWDMMSLDFLICEQTCSISLMPAIMQFLLKWLMSVSSLLNLTLILFLVSPYEFNSAFSSMRFLMSYLIYLATSSLFPISKKRSPKSIGDK